MKLLLKHIMRSIGKKPLQPIILILTLMLSVATSIFAFTVEDTLDAEAEAAQAAKYGSADFTVGLSGASDSRFMFAATAEEILDGKATVVGCYELPLIIGKSADTAVGVATDLGKINELFEIEFTAYGIVTGSSVSHSAFVSPSFAEKHGLGVGDALEVETLGEKSLYYIQGISTIPFMDSYDVMVDITGVVRIFAKNSSLFAALGEDFRPCSTLFVDVTYDDHDGETDEVAACMELLASDDRFDDKSFSDVRHIEIIRSGIASLDAIVSLAVALAALLSAVITFCCFYILASERAEESVSLVCSGAGPGAIAVMQYAEAFIYWLIAAPLGILLSVPVTGTLALFVGLKYTTVSVKPMTAVKSALIILAICLITALLFVESAKRERRSGERRKTNLRPTLCMTAVLAVMFILLFVVPTDLRFEAYILTLAAIIALTFICVPPLLQRLAKLLDKALSASSKSATVTFRYALKNVSSLKMLHNISRLCALIVLIVLTVSLVFAGTSGFLNIIPTVIDADYAVINSTDRCYSKTAECESVESIYRFHLSQASITSILSAEDISAFSDTLDITVQPKGALAVVSLGISDMLSLKVGDRFEIELDSTKAELEVAEIAESGVNFIAIDCEHFGIPYNMLLVKGKDGVEKSELLAELSEKTSSELATVVSADTMLQSLADSTRIYLNSGRILLSVFIFFSIIGMADTLYESLRARKEEFELYRIAGMSAKSIRLMKLYEVGIALVFGLLTALATSIAATFATNEGISSFGFEVFLNFKNRFK